jgi:hypothetical protein
MTTTIYNISMLAGLALIGAGVAMVSVPAALVVVGGLVVSLTLIAAFFSRKG